MDRVGLRLADDSGLGWSRSPSIAIEARVPAKPLSRALPKVVCMYSLHDSLFEAKPKKGSDLWSLFSH
jgi:hypothetical protein